MKKLMCILVLVLLLAGCKGNNNHGEEIDLAPDPIQTEEPARLTLDSLRKSSMTPFIMPQYGTEDYDYYSSLLTWGDECIPGKLYLKCAVSRTEEAILLLSDLDFRIETGMYNFQPWDRRMIYAVAVGEDGDSLVKVDQETGQDTTLYHVDGERIRFMLKDGNIYFSSGSRILCLNIYTDEVETFAECEGEVSDLAATLGSIAWADGGGNYFLYDYEKGEGVPIDYEELFPFHERYYYFFRDQEDGISTLYLVTRETDEEELIEDNIKAVLYASVNQIYAQVGNEYITYVDDTYAQVGNECIIYVDNTYGNIETVYNAVTDDMELIGCAKKQPADFEDRWLIYVREGDELVVLDSETQETSTLFRLENGLSDLMNASIVTECQAASANFDYNFIEGVSDQDFYICGECADNNLPCFIWADKDKDWFWYHPHSGDNERIEVIPYGWSSYFIKQAD